MDETQEPMTAEEIDSLERCLLSANPPTRVGPVTILRLIAAARASAPPPSVGREEIAGLREALSDATDGLAWTPMSTAHNSPAEISDFAQAAYERATAALQRGTEAP